MEQLMSLNRSAIQSLAAGRRADVRRQRAEPRGDSSEIASPQHGRGHADRLVEGARQVNGGWVDPAHSAWTQWNPKRSLHSPECRETAIPQMPAWRAGPPRRRRGGAEARSCNDIAALFKNFDLSVQSAAPMRSLLFAWHRGDRRRADMRRWQ